MNGYQPFVSWWYLCVNSCSVISLREVLWPVRERLPDLLAYSFAIGHHRSHQSQSYQLPLRPYHLLGAFSYHIRKCGTAWTPARNRIENPVAWTPAH